MASKVLAAPAGLFTKAQPTTHPATVHASAHAWHVAGWVGFGLALIGWADVALGMYPYRVGNPDWEFGAVSAALDSMPLGTIGLGAVTAATILSGRKVLARVLSIFHGLVVLFLLSAITLYSLSVPVVVKAVPAAMQSQLSIAIAKALLLGVVYCLLYVVMSRASWRAAATKIKRVS